jgi:hypothetical protein
VHADQAATRTSRGHCAEDCRVVHEENSGISHEHLETGHAFIHCGEQFLDLLVFQFSGD